MKLTKNSIAELFQVDTRQALKTIRGHFEDLYRSDAKKACASALRLTAKLKRNDRLDAINSLLSMYGVEAIRGEWQDGYWCDIVAAYCNTGDTYALTVMEVRGERSFYTSRFLVTSWGDWVEANSEKYSIV